MTFLGISRDTGAVYVGESQHSGYRCTVAPFISPLRFLSGVKDVEASKFDDEDVLLLPRRVFKEDSFDPVSRVRRGSVYHAYGGQPAVWYVQDPFRQDVGNAAFHGDGSKFEVSLITYHHDPLNYLTISPTVPIRATLGKEPFATTWRVVGIESTALRTPVMTLKSESLFGEVPEIVPDAVPPSIRERLTAAMGEVASSVHRLSPVAVVDRCRDALALVFAEMAGDPSLDLMPAVEAWAKKSGGREDVRAWCGKIVARFHSRGKPNEAISKGLREVTDEDAVFAVHCLGTVLRDQGWARR
jgi:hypothetical protein